VCIAVFTGGRHPAPRSAAPIFAQNGLPVYIVAADSGLIAAEEYASFFGFGVDRIVGDMDSLDSLGAAGRLAKYPAGIIERWNRDKDDSDTELALKEACAYRAGHAPPPAAPETDIPAPPVVLVGGSGGRSDHFAAVIRTLGSAHSPDIWLAEEQAVYVLNAESPRAALAVRGLTEADAVSVFPCRPDSAAKIRAEGLFWDINALDWSVEASLSNKIAPDYARDSRPVSFFAIRGAFSVYVPLDGICREAAQAFGGSRTTEFSEKTLYRGKA
jgi:thiamine pyrophosphokinase